MYTLPSVGDLTKKISATTMDREDAKRLLKEVTEVIKPVYNITEELYTKHDLHGLP